VLPGHLSSHHEQGIEQQLDLSYPIAGLCGMRQAFESFVTGNTTKKHNQALLLETNLQSLS
jgi:hypothetical protein